MIAYIEPTINSAPVREKSNSYLDFLENKLAFKVLCRKLQISHLLDHVAIFDSDFYELLRRVFLNLQEKSKYRDLGLDYDEMIFLLEYYITAYEDFVKFDWASVQYTMIKDTDVYTLMNMNDGTTIDKFVKSVLIQNFVGCLEFTDKNMLMSKGINEIIGVIAVNWLLNVSNKNWLIQVEES